MTVGLGEGFTVSGPPGARPIVLVHGAMDRATGMAKLARKLDDRYRVYRFDRRGYAHRVTHPGPFTVAGNVDDVCAILATVTPGSPPPVVVGHSMGGVIALAAAAWHPDLVAGVVVFEPPLPWIEWWPATSASAEARAVATDPAEAAERFMRRLIGDARWEGLPQRTRQIRRREGVALSAELADLVHRPFEFADVRCPVVVGASEAARAHHRRATTLLAAELPDARLVTLAGTAHDAHASAPGAFVSELIEPLVRRLDASAASSVSEG